MGIAVDANDARLRPVVQRIKELEHQGFQFEAAEASFRLLLESAVGDYREFFSLESYEVTTQHRKGHAPMSRATVRVSLDGALREGTAEGCGPVHALDRALRLALSDGFACLAEVHLVDYKVRVLDADRATAAKVRVLVRTRDSDEAWSTVGVSENILEASWQALADSINYKLNKERQAAAYDAGTRRRGDAATESSIAPVAASPSLPEVHHVV
jgi:2-isopropylmalate synthase